MCSCEMPEFFESKAVKGRKEYNCCECGVVIEKGETHQSSTGKWDGRVETFRQCLPCHQVMKDCMSRADCACDVGFTALVDWVWEARDDRLPTDIAERFQQFRERRSAVEVMG